MNFSFKLWLQAATTLSLAACGGGDNSSMESVNAFEPKLTCENLKSIEIASSEIGLPTRGAATSSAELIIGTDTVPDHCLVVGEIRPVDANAEPIKFKLALPTQWNKRLMHLGGSGLNGNIPDVTGTPFISGPPALSRGYAVVGSDSGHSVKTGVSAAAFALNDEMLQNFASDQLKKTRDTAAALLKLRYTLPLEKTYFIGGSEGGRESMIVVQRYPMDYDAVFSLFPVLNYMPDKMLWQKVGRAMRTNGGAGWLNAEKANLLNNAEVTACDMLDGAADRLISNVAACTFDPAVLRCEGGQDTGNTCLSDAQLETTRVFYNRTNWNFELANGTRSIANYFHGTAFSGNLGTSAAYNPMTSKTGENALELGYIHYFGDAISKYFIQRDPNADTLSFDPSSPGNYLPRMQQLSQMLDATSTDISAFMARGGKWIVMHGSADPLPLVQSTTEYYEGLVARYGKTNLDKTLRYYTIPGFSHANGPFNATGGIPALDALERWERDGVAPGTLEVYDGQGNRTRPLCLYPAWPKYKGTGNLNTASSYSCATS